MEILFMSAGIVSTIVLCIVGIVKMPFKTFKQKHPKWFKAVFTILSFVLAVCLSIVDEIYILCGQIFSIDFAILISVVLAGVFFGYNGVYEGFGLKEFLKKIVEKVKEARCIASDKKVIKYLNKIDDIDMAISFLEDRKNNQTSEV